MPWHSNVWRSTTTSRHILEQASTAFGKLIFSELTVKVRPDLMPWAEAVVVSQDATPATRAAARAAWMRIIWFSFDAMEGVFRVSRVRAPGGLVFPALGGSRARAVSRVTEEGSVAEAHEPFRTPPSETHDANVSRS